MHTLWLRFVALWRTDADTDTDTGGIVRWSSESAWRVISINFLYFICLEIAAKTAQSNTSSLNKKSLLHLHCHIANLIFHEVCFTFAIFRSYIPDSQVHGANIGPTWVLSAPDGPHVGPMNLAIADNTQKHLHTFTWSLHHHRVNHTIAPVAVKQLQIVWIIYAMNPLGTHDTTTLTESKIKPMMTSSNGNIFRDTGPLCGEFTGDRLIPRTKGR